MKASHKGMGITKADYAAFMRCLTVSLDTFNVSEPERGEVVAFTTPLGAPACVCGASGRRDENRQGAIRLPDQPGSYQACSRPT
jgi:hypothetical protein